MTGKTHPACKLILVAGFLGINLLQPTCSKAAETSELAPDASVNFQDAVLEAFSYMKQGNFVRAEPALQKIIASPGFAQLNDELQHAVLSATGYAERELKEWQKAHALFLRASEMPNATGDDWIERTWTASMLNDFTEAVLALTTIVNSWPDALDTLSDRFVFRVVSEARKLPDPDLNFNLLSALYNKYWKVADGREPGFLWRELALQLIARNQLEHATEVAAHVGSARELIQMQADARFYSVLETDPGQFDVNEGLNLEISLLRAAAGKEPRKLEHIVELQYLLLAARQYEDAVKLADTAVAAISNGKKGQPAFDDIDDELPWIMDNRARALVRLGRSQDAINQFTQAARMNEHGQENVSQAINLAELLMDLNRSDEALAAISKVENTSPYGRMQLEYVKFVTAYQKQDAKSADAAMSYLNSHQKDAASTYSDVLLVANRLDEAAQVLIVRLENADSRALALLDMQEFATRTHEAPLEKLLRERFEAVKSRPDVQTALAKVGRIRHYDIDRPET